MPKGDFIKTTDSIVPLRGVVRAGKLVSLLDQDGVEIGAPVTAVESVTGGVEIFNLSTVGNNVAFIGDSRVRYGRAEWFKNISPDDSGGIDADWLGVGPGVTVDSSVGTLEFRASDKSFRWAAPSDAAGEWNAATLGRMVIDSGTAGREIYFVLRSIDGLPATDQSVSMTCTGTMFARVEWKSAVTEVMSKYRNGPLAHYLGAGGASTADCREMLPWYAASAAGLGVDVLRLGTNDISASIPASSMIANAAAVFDARLALGRRLVICGEPARWGVNTSTPMTAQQLADLIAYNKALCAYATARPTNCRYVDLYAISRDPAHVDGRPAAGILSDTVHDGVAGSLAFASAIVKAMDVLGGLSAAPYPMAGDAGVLFNSASTWMTGNGGTVGTAASGEAPTGISVGRAAGSDMTIVASIVGYDDHAGRRTQLDITSISANNIASCHSTLPVSAPTIASLGLAVGDVVEFEVDLEVVSGAPTQIEVFILVGGSAKRAVVYFPGVVGSYHQKSAPIKLMSGDTTLRQMSYYTLAADSSAVIRIGEFVTRKCS